MNFSVALLISAILVVPSLKGLTHSYTLPWPPLRDLITRDESPQDVLMTLAGFRRLAADIAWVQMLQYVGEEEAFEGHSHFRDEQHPHKEKPVDLFERAMRITRLDPYFHDAYLYGAGVLAWTPRLEQTDKALEILKEGKRWNPEYWPIQTYTVAILYKKQLKVPEMTALLERTIRQPDCPITVKSVLANYYKQQKQYGDAIRIWNVVLENPNDRWYADHARQQINLIHGLISASTSSSAGSNKPR